MKLKSTYLVNISWGTNKLAGFSESFYDSQADLKAGALRIRNLATLRATTLPPEATIVGYRVSDIEHPHVSYSGSLNLQGSARFNGIGGNQPARTDTPWQSLLVKFTGGGSTRTAAFRGIPDEWVLNGVFLQDALHGASLITFANAVVTRGFYLLQQDKSSELFDVLGVSTSGVLTTFQAQPLVKGDAITFSRTRDVNGRSVKGIWKISTDPVDSFTFQLANWPTGREVEEGKAKLANADITVIQEQSIFRMGSRKVGRPFGQLVGRATRG